LFKKQPFEFQTDKRLRAVSRSQTPEPVVPRFEARPVNKDLFTRVTGVPDKVFQELTIPESPAITKKRARLDKEPSPDQLLFKVPIPVGL